MSANDDTPKMPTNGDTTPIDNPGTAPTFNPLHPNAKELRAIEAFLSADKTRSFQETVWVYESEGGVSYMATNGHVITLRRSGTHRTMPPADIYKLEEHALDKSVDHAGPPEWGFLFHAPNCEGPNLPLRSIDPRYVGLVSKVEEAATARAKADHPRRSRAIRAIRDIRYAVFAIGCDPLDPWYWKLDTEVALWEGLIMPRRIP